MNVEGLTGAGIQMVSHGIMTALFFAVVGMIYDRAHTRSMDELSGMAKALPWTVVAFVIGGLVSMGMPGLSGFIAEFPIFLGVWRGGAMNLGGTFLGLNPASFYPTVALLAVLAIVITAAYVLRAINDVFLGDYDASMWHDMKPLLAIDKFTLLFFCVILVLIGIFPAVIEPIVRAGILPVVERLDNAQVAFAADGGSGNVLKELETAVLYLRNWLGGT
jgi:NADH-quinone oxidoreductase subunit M